LKDRDANDLNREFAPLKIASDAIFIDNGELSIDQTFEKIQQHINLKLQNNA
ncbi:MAG: (d)CMP kinase, partial [Alphaproteobacteria bacterium]